MSQSVQAVFRSLASLEKTVEKCHIVLDKKKNRLTFTLHCKHGNGAFLQPPMVAIIFLCFYKVDAWFTITFFPEKNLKKSFIFFAGLLKTHNLSFQDSESLQAVFDKDSCGNVFKAKSRSVESMCHLYCNVLQ